MLYTYNREVFMEEEIIELKEEIELLTERINILEKTESRRKAFAYTKILVRVIMLLLFAYGVWRGYEYVVNEIPQLMEEKIKEINPIKKNL